MPHIEIPATWAHSVTPETDRECGPCYACCVWLGIEELKKHTGQTCKHLAGGTDPSKRCSIYSSRPSACSGYQCMWRAGWGPDNLRPYESGILITCYHSETIPDTAAATVNVFDKALAAPHLKSVIGELMTLPIISEVRLIFVADKRATLFKNGLIFDCDLLPQEGFESLTFTAHDPPVGRYEVQQRSP